MDTLFDERIASLSALPAAVNGCRRCPLWANATQGVPGAGPEAAEVMFVGEQPGDQEDLAGTPFVGPAGQVFNRGLADAGIDRTRVYVTNAVKHFKFIPRGKRRIHQKPSTGEIDICRWWLDIERELVKPTLVVALGATALRGLTGKTQPLGASRGRPLEFTGGQAGFATVHPSYLLRLPDEASKEVEYRRFVEDLAMIAEAAPNVRA